ncbi:MAG: hypothetical protein KKC68_05610 [Candidatus Thermoplasmatota archaeon]|nr:hypothetical protein [Candidatus Thermoplasmatota archaeon]MBU1941232.1 hypothetical protein [Candidatus Thermoplasmatota archaeon]
MIKLKPKQLKPTPVKKVQTEKKPLNLKLPEITGLTTLSGILKLRIAVIIIFLMMTIAFTLAITSEFAFSVALILLSYLGVLVLLIKLFLIKKI